MKKTIFYSIALLLISGCIRELEIDLPETPTKLVAIGSFKPGETFKVKLAFSQTVYDNGKPVAPQNADVSVSVNGQFYDRLVRVVRKGEVTWEGNALIFGETPYTLSAQVAGYPPVLANSSVPSHTEIEPVEIKSSDISFQQVGDGNMAMVIPIELRFKEDKPAEKPFYAFSLKHEVQVFEVVNGQKLPDYVKEAAPTFYLTDGRTFSLLHNIAEPVVLINERYWSQGQSSILLNAYIPFSPQNEAPLRILLEWRTLSEEFYRYHLSIARQGNNLPLSDPDAVYNNIAGGYGNFSGYFASFDTIPIPEF